MSNTTAIVTAQPRSTHALAKKELITPGSLV
jgi:hypothetical protein